MRMCITDIPHKDLVDSENVIMMALNSSKRNLMKEYPDIDKVYFFMGYIENGNRYVIAAGESPFYLNSDTGFLHCENKDNK